MNKFFNKIIFICIILSSMLFVSCINFEEEFIVNDYEIKFVADVISIKYTLNNVLISDQLNVSPIQRKYMKDNINSFELSVYVEYKSGSRKLIAYYVDGVLFTTNYWVLSEDQILKIMENSHRLTEDQVKTKVKSEQITTKEIL